MPSRTRLSGVPSFGLLDRRRTVGRACRSGRRRGCRSSVVVEPGVFTVGPAQTGIDIPRSGAVTACRTRSGTDRSARGRILAARGPRCAGSWRRAAARTEVSRGRISTVSAARASASICTYSAGSSVASACTPISADPAGRCVAHARGSTVQRALRAASARSTCAIGRARPCRACAARSPRTTGPRRTTAGIRARAACTTGRAGSCARRVATGSTTARSRRSAARAAARAGSTTTTSCRATAATASSSSASRAAATSTGCSCPVAWLKDQGAGERQRGDDR
jgi:hypothetical protein